MTRASGFVVLAALAAADLVAVPPASSGRAAPHEGDGRPGVKAPALEVSATGAVVAANGGKPPATGQELVKVLARLGKFVQLPVAFSAVHFESGLANPRVVIAEVVNGLGEADANRPNLAGRLFLAANMERGANGGDPRVVSVEFISWNTARRRFDFGLIENMGGEGTPDLHVVDGGRCFACHKNRGPILGASPWTNTTNFALVQNLVSARLNVVPAVPLNAAGPGMRDRIDGMALVAPQAIAVDGAVRLGAAQRLNREGFQLMNRSTGGRKAFVALLVAITAPGPLDPNDRHTKAAVDTWDDQTYIRFAADWVALSKATNSGILADQTHFPKAQASLWSQNPQPVPTPPAGGFASAAAAKSFEWNVKKVTENNEAIRKAVIKQTELIETYDAARAEGKHKLPSAAQPSNPRAFLPGPTKAAQRPSGIVNPTLLAGVIGLTEGDRKFLARSLADAAEKVKKAKVTAATLAKEVFEGPEFADVLAGGPLPDRDEFKDRFAAGLDALLRTRYKLADGFAIDRKDYASGPRYDLKAVGEIEAAVVPTTACLRCHDVRGSGTPRAFEPIPALAFDPFDKAGREAWVKTADAKRKREVLARMLARLHEDADMPPTDSPEHELFRVKDAAAFADVKAFLEAELPKPKAP